MSIQIRVSFEHEGELRDVLNHLEPLGIAVKRAPAAGRFMRAYITLRASKNKRLTKPPERATMASTK